MFYKLAVVYKLKKIAKSALSTVPNPKEGIYLNT